jgi:predicted  nucleic acid-binding Zn-ribbon protein
MSHPILDLQAAETTAEQLKHRRERLPEREQAEAARNALDNWDAARQRLHQRLDELGVQIERSETDAHEIDRHRTRLEAQLKTVIAPREAEALQNEIANLNERRGGLDDAELAAMEEQTVLEDELTVLLGREAVLREAIAAADAALAIGEADIEVELSDIAARLEGLRAQVGPSVLARYDRLRQHFVVAAAMLSGSRCEGCHLDLSAHEVDDVKDEIAANGVADCPQCGRLLVR